MGHGTSVSFEAAKRAQARRERAKIVKSEFKDSSGVTISFDFNCDGKISTGEFGIKKQYYYMNAKLVKLQAERQKVEQKYDGKIAKLQQKIDDNAAGKKVSRSWFSSNNPKDWKKQLQQLQIEKNKKLVDLDVKIAEKKLEMAKLIERSQLLSPNNHSEEAIKAKIDAKAAAQGVASPYIAPEERGFSLIPKTNKEKMRQAMNAQFLRSNVPLPTIAPKPKAKTEESSTPNFEPFPFVPAKSTETPTAPAAQESAHLEETPAEPVPEPEDTETDETAAENASQTKTAARPLVFKQQETEQLKPFSLRDVIYKPILGYKLPTLEEFAANAAATEPAVIPTAPAAQESAHLEETPAEPVPEPEDTETDETAAENASQTETSADPVQKHEVGETDERAAENALQTETAAEVPAANAEVPEVSEVTETVDVKVDAAAPAPATGVSSSASAEYLTLTNEQMALLQSIDGSLSFASKMLKSKNVDLKASYADFQKKFGERKITIADVEEAISVAQTLRDEYKRNFYIRGQIDNVIDAAEKLLNLEKQARGTGTATVAQTASAGEVEPAASKVSAEGATALQEVKNAEIPVKSIADISSFNKSKAEVLLYDIRDNLKIGTWCVVINDNGGIEKLIDEKSFEEFDRKRQEKTITNYDIRAAIAMAKEILKKYPGGMGESTIKETIAKAEQLLALIEKNDEYSL